VLVKSIWVKWEPEKLLALIPLVVGMILLLLQQFPFWSLT